MSTLPTEETVIPWLFDAEKVIDVAGRNQYQARVFGFLAEGFSSYYFSRYCEPRYASMSMLRLPTSGDGP